MQNCSEQKHTNFFSILKGAICEKASESIFFYFFFASRSVAMVFGKQEETSFAHGSVNTREKKRFCDCLDH